MQEILEYDLREIEAKANAIEEIKTYFGSVQKDIQKRRNIETVAKTKAIQDLVTVYKGVNGSKNEGENSLRRLKEMHTGYTAFLSEHPRANITNPIVVSLREQTKPTATWIYEKLAAYDAALKKAKRGTARRVRKVVEVNSATLQHELNTIKSRLNAHNSGIAKLHHMTVKSLRKKKTEAEQKLRNLAPPTNNARNNAAANNAAANNQAGGRRTRKLRR
jgi:hypothetical protein